MNLIDAHSKIQNFSLIQNVRSAVELLSLFCQTFRRMPESCGGCPFLSYCEMVSDGEIIPLETIIKDILMPAVVEYADTKLQEAEQTADPFAGFAGLVAESWEERRRRNRRRHLKKTRFAKMGVRI